MLFEARLAQGMELPDFIDYSAGPEDEPQAVPPQEDSLLNTKQIAEMLGVSPAMVTNWRKRGVGFPEPQIENVPTLTCPSCGQERKPRRPYYLRSEIGQWAQNFNNGRYRQAWENANRMNVPLPTTRQPKPPPPEPEPEPEPELRQRPVRNEWGQLDYS